MRKLLVAAVMLVAVVLTFYSIEQQRYNDELLIGQQQEKERIALIQEYKERWGK